MAIWGTPLTWIAAIAIRARRLGHPRSPRRWRRRAGRAGAARRRSPACPGASSPGRPASASPGAESRMPSLPATCSASKARSATPVSIVAIVSASSSRPRLLKAPSLHPLQRELLDRGPGPVGVEPDLAEEDAVGPGDRAFAHVHRVGAVEAVGEVAQAASHRLRALARAAVDLDRGDREAGELGGDVRGDPARLGAGSQPRSVAPVAARAALTHAPSRRVARSSASTRRSSSATLSSPTLALSRVPPG